MIHAHTRSMRNSLHNQLLDILHGRRFDDRQVRNKCAQTEKRLAIAAHEVQRVFWFPCKSLVGRRVEYERELGFRRQSQKQSNVSTCQPVATRELYHFVVEVSIEDYEVVATATQLRHNPA